MVSNNALVHITAHLPDEGLYILLTGLPSASLILLFLLLCRPACFQRVFYF